MLKRISLILVFVTFVYAWFFLFYKNSHPSSLKVAGADTNISLFVEPDAGESPILDAIRNAKKEILIEVYLLSDKDFISSLENAKARGVAVNVMLEKYPVGGGKLNSKSKDELTSHGIAVTWTNPAFTLTHEKTVVIDGSAALILTQNLTLSSFTKNREYDVIDKNIDDVNEIRTIFLNDWQKNTFTAPLNTHLIVSPDNSRVALTTLINNAQSEIDIEIEDINDKDIISLLKNKAQTIKVNLILPTISQVSSNSVAIDDLQNSKVNIKTISSPYIHAKLILVDNKSAYIGSINLSTQSLDANREVGIILSDKNSIQTLTSTFQNDWNISSSKN